LIENLQVNGEKRERNKNKKAFDLFFITCKPKMKIVEQYKQAITDKTKVILLTPCFKISIGLVVPDATKIAAKAKQKGIDTIADSAHALGQTRRLSLPALRIQNVVA
jgi:dTDP-4-amino-4,6-dideoxygalactose transaminase